MRAVLLAIVATLALAGGFTSTADAGDGPHRTSATTVDGSGGAGYLLDPSDPEIPPGP